MHIPVPRRRSDTTTTEPTSVTTRARSHAKRALIVTVAVVYAVVCGIATYKLAEWLRL